MTLAQGSRLKAQGGSGLVRPGSGDRRAGEARGSIEDRSRLKALGSREELTSVLPSAFSLEPSASSASSLQPPANAGQSILEYLAVAVALFAAVALIRGLVQTKTNSLMQEAVQREFTMTSGTTVANDLLR